MTNEEKRLVNELLSAVDDVFGSMDRWDNDTGSGLRDDGYRATRFVRHTDWTNLDSTRKALKRLVDKN